MDLLIEPYNTSGLVLLIVSALAWSTSHLALVKQYKNMDFSFRIIGFVSFILIFILSGIKAGLMAIPIILLVSILGTLFARQFRT